MILIFGNKNDVCATKTYDYLSQQGSEVIFIDACKLLTDVGVNYSIASPNFDSFLTVNSHKVKLTDFSGVLARLQPRFETDADMTKEDQFYTRSELEAAWKGLLKLLSFQVINSQSTNVDNISMIFSASLEQAIANCGFKIPKKLIASNFENASQFYKSCSYRAILSSVSKQIYWQLIEGEEGLKYLQECIAQQSICLQEAPLGRWLQEFTIGDRVFGALLPVKSMPGEIGKTNIQTFEPSLMLQEKCRRLAQALHLDFGQFYLLQTHEGEEYCFEVRNFPTYEYCDEILQDNITATLGELLKKGNKKYEVEVLN